MKAIFYPKKPLTESSKTIKQFLSHFLYVTFYTSYLKPTIVNGKIIPKFVCENEKNNFCRQCKLHVNKER